MLKAAVVGLGMAGHHHARFYANEPEVNLVAVVEPHQNHLTDLLHPLPVLGSLEELWSAVPDIDLISVCSPPSAHSSTVLDAVARGVACICEKPLATPAASAVKILSSCDQYDVPVIPVHNYAYSPWWQSIKSASWMPLEWEALIVRMERPHPAVGVAGWRTGWRTEQGMSGGGVLWDIGVHALYLAQELFDAPPAAATTLAWQEEKGCETACEVFFDFTGGRQLRFTGSWRSLERVSQWRVCPRSPDRVKPGQPDLIWKSPTGTGHWLQGVFNEYLAARQGSRRWRKMLQAAALAIVAAETARTSARAQGHRVSLDRGMVASIVSSS